MTLSCGSMALVIEVKAVLCVCRDQGLGVLSGPCRNRRLVKDQNSAGDRGRGQLLQWYRNWT